MTAVVVIGYSYPESSLDIIPTAALIRAEKLTGQAYYYSTGALDIEIRLFLYPIIYLYLIDVCIS